MGSITMPLPTTIAPWPSHTFSPCVLHFGLVDYQSQVRALVDGTVQNAADEVIEGVVHRALESIPKRTRLAI
jgi:hypothetical protein